jgi:hypothetical protein
MAETIGTSSQRPVRQWPFVARTRPLLEISESDRPAVAYRPAFYLPTVFMDMELRDWIVIPKGTILAVDTTYKTLTVANGGNAATDTYTINDQNAAVKKADLSLAVAGDTLTRAANIPVGIAPKDMLMDIRGRYLNYQNQPDAHGILCERTIEVPYFTWEDLGSPSEANAILYAKAKIGGLAYAHDNAANLVEGDFLMSDVNGKFIKWDEVSVKQIVGQVILVDLDFPKDMLQYVQTYPYSEMAGSETGGFPNHLANVGATKALRLRLKF